MRGLFAPVRQPSEGVQLQDRPEERQARGAGSQRSPARRLVHTIRCPIAEVVAWIGSARHAGETVRLEFRLLQVLAVLQ